MKKKIVTFLMAAVLLLGVFTGCRSDTKNVEVVKLDPNNPIAITVWHYYNGAQQAAFDRLVSEFNATVGKEQGIYVEGKSQGSVSDLEQAVTDAIEGKVGAEDVPNIFASYSDLAYTALNTVGLADLTRYFTQDDIDKYVEGYIREGYLNNGEALYLFPTAKSTEITMINETAWEPFAEQTGVTKDMLLTDEGIVEVAKKYYEWSGGKAFYGRDSMANYFVIGMKQLGTEIFEVTGDGVKLNADKEKIRRLWDNWYVPTVEGWFAGYGRFRSDDVKTGDIIAYTGSSSSSMYFPDCMETAEGSESIDYDILNAPIFDGGENVKVQQGAGMAVTKSDTAHEYAACVFLKWFTETENNYKFVCESSYMPVTKESHSVEALDKALNDNNLEINQKAYDCLKMVISHDEGCEYYTASAFANGMAARKVLDYNLSDKAKADLEEINAKVAAGRTREEAVAPYITDEAFDRWYEDFVSALNTRIGR